MLPFSYIAFGYRRVANASGTVTQKNHYYPFGTTFAENTSADAQPYKYNGKELDKMHGLNLHDYSARYYESVIGRFTTIDPKAEKYYSISPYTYCLNNPLKYIDPRGDTVRIHIETIENGHVWITTGEEDDLKLYSYGPHEKGNNPISDGKLTVKTGRDAHGYMTGKKAGTNVTSYALKDISDSDMDDAMDKVMSNAYKTRKAESNDEEGSTGDYFIEDYVPISNNCTTFVSEMIHKSGSNILGKEYIPSTMGNLGGGFKVNRSFILPSSMKSFIERRVNSIPSIVDKVRTP